MESLNLPIEMISLCALDGQLRPLRFRYEDEQHDLRVVRIDEVLSANAVSYVGVQRYIYLCRAQYGGKQLVFELSYTVKTHSWTLSRFFT